MKDNHSDTSTFADSTLNSDVTYSIGELSKDLDVTPRSIRFYEEQGLLAPKRVGQSRVYSKKDRVRLKLVLRGKRLGFSLSETKTLFNLYDSHTNSKIQLQAMLEMTEQKRAILNQQLEDIRMLMTELDDVESRCRDELDQINKGKSE
ncbi:MerR family DNA-binding transcriptional regulator [Aliiglaciecola litoralis]|uniref:MerR family DNA-binding transcriptional regulator n=1 Tax=Aliiglaciecola litoralis TaxID=582857 RepID=A0ABN1LL21_9ALTE